MFIIKTFCLEKFFSHFGPVWRQESTRHMCLLIGHFLVVMRPLFYFLYGMYIGGSESTMGKIPVFREILRNVLVTTPSGTQGHSEGQGEREKER